MTLKLRVLLAGLVLCMAGTMSSASGQDEMKFNVKGENPGGKGGYLGEVLVKKLSEFTAAVQWTTGPKKDVTEGIAIRTGVAIGAAYGGDDLYALAVYELQGKTIKAVWTTAANPAVSGNYVLKGANYKGACTFSDGTPGTVTFTPGEGGMYKVTWDLASGHYEGVGVRTGDVLVAASGKPKGSFGVAAYQPKGDDIAGVWGTTGTPTAGKETWSLGEEADAGKPAPGKAGQTVSFGGDTYELKENKSAPGQATSELREYLQKGEDWDGYRKMVALRFMNLKADAATVARNHLAQVQKDHADSFVKEVNIEADSSTIMFILVNGADVELNLWNYRKTEAGVASAQFVFRNKPPFETQRKFKTEQDNNYVTWVADLEELGGESVALMKATAQGTGATASAGSKPEMSDEELARAIKVDMDKCVAVAKKFVGAISAGSVADAAALMSGSAFKNAAEKAEFSKKLEKSTKAFGELKDFAADKEATDFGMKDGVMTFTLFGDGEYENAKVRETFTFIRNGKGEVEFVGYNRKIKE